MKGAALTPATVFRRRTGWEAADMGMLLWQTNWLPLLLFTGIPAGILTLLTNMLPGDSGITVGAFVFWWFKPFIDRFCLQVVSVRFFEPEAPFGRLFRGLFTALRKGLAADLLWRRFSSSRSARMPLVVLERLKGKNYRRRKQLLARNGLGFGPALTVICLGMALVLEAGELLFLYGIFDLIQDGYAGTIFDFMLEENIMVSILSWVNFVLIETLYVCMGFGLYINSRVETEGWDIELLFKKCVEKAGARNPATMPSSATTSPVTTPQTAPLLPAAIPLLALLLFFCFSVPAQAQEAPPVEQKQQIEQEQQDEQEPPDQRLEQMVLRPAELSEQEQKMLDGVFDSMDFGTEKATWKIQFKQSDEEKPNAELKRSLFPNLREIIGKILRLVLGAALAAAVLIGAVYAYRNRARLSGLAGKSRAQRELVPDEPRRLLEEAENLHRAGKIREAWALCFRAFAAFFAGHFPLPAEATEYEALALARKNGVNTGGFDVFVRRWVAFAYGGRMPAAGMFEESLDGAKEIFSEHDTGEKS